MHTSTAVDAVSPVTLAPGGVVDILVTLRVAYLRVTRMSTTPPGARVTGDTASTAVDVCTGTVVAVDVKALYQPFQCWLSATKQRTRVAVEMPGLDSNEKFVLGFGSLTLRRCVPSNNGVEVCAEQLN